MKGAVLFLFTMMMVVPSNRTAVADYVDHTIARLAAESPFPQVVLVSIGLVTLLLLLILRDQSTECPARYIVFRETRGPVGDDASARVPERRRFRHTGTLMQLVRVLRNAVVDSIAARLSGSSAGAQAAVVNVDHQSQVAGNPRTRIATDRYR